MTGGGGVIGEGSDGGGKGGGGDGIRTLAPQSEQSVAM